MSFRNVSVYRQDLTYLITPVYMRFAQFHLKHELNDFGFNWFIGEIFILIEFSSGQCQLEHDNHITCSHFYQ